MIHIRSFDGKIVNQVDRLLADARQASGAGMRRVRILAQGPGFTLRQVVLMSGEELPFRRNPDQIKTWRVISGRGHADVYEADMALMPGAEVEVAPGALHQIENRDCTPLVMQELRIDFAASVDMRRAAQEVFGQVAEKPVQP